MDLGIRRQSRASFARSLAWKILSTFALASALAGCESTDGANADDGASGSGGSSGSSSGGSRTGGSGGTGGSVSGAVQLTDDNNYATTSLLEPGNVITASGTSLHIDWSALTTDMQCHGMDPMTDIGKVALLRFRNLSKPEAAALLTAGELEMADIDGYIQFETGGDQTECELSDLSNLGTPVNIEDEYVEAPDKTYMLLWATGERPGTGARTMTFLTPSADEPNTDVVAEPGCDPDTGEGILDFTATFKTPVTIPAGKTVVDWRSVTKDGLGNDLFANNIDRVLLGFYAGKTPEQLAEQIFDIELIADDLWEVDHGGGFQNDLRTLRRRGSTDDFFPGFDGYPEGTWLLGLMCSICQNPAPLVLAVLEPAGG
jgi:hypothetical protein